MKEAAKVTSTVSNQSALGRFVAAAVAAGCPHDQLEHLNRAGIVLQPRQLAASAAARQCDRPDGPTAVGFGGARCGGKTFWLLAQLGLDDCQRFPGLKCLLLRKVGKSNRENFEDLRLRLFHRLPHDYAATRATLTFANGSRIIAGHYQCEKDIDAYLGLEYDVIGIEEATTLTSRKYHDVATCCRSSKPGWRPRIYSTTNPGGVGHAWYREAYVAPFQQGAESTTRFIPATLDDNAFINPEYRHNLDTLTGWQLRAWRHGDWDIAAGQFFTAFRRDIHTIDDFCDARGVEWVAALDYGFSHYTVALLGAYDSDRNLYLVDEHAARGWIPERHAEAIIAMLSRHNVYLHPKSTQATRLKRFIAGADLFATRHTGYTIAQEYENHGISFCQAKMDRINGWAAIHKALGDPAAGIAPKLFIHRRCSRLVEALPALQHDPGNPEDVLKVDSDENGLGGDDAADALRYLVATKIPTLIVRKLHGL
jgi:hypothetical protein